MRRRQSDELLRLEKKLAWPSFRMRRQYVYYLIGFVFACWLLYPTHKPVPEPVGVFKINWSSYAYSVYATDSASLCHAVMVLDALARFGSKADRVLFYPEHWDTTVESSRDRDSQLLNLARDVYKARLYPVKPLQVAGRTETEWLWDETVTKLMAFSLEYYDRVISLDSDITLLGSLDELFLLPRTPIAMPRAYWTDSKPWPLSTKLMVIEPNAEQLEKFKILMEGGGDSMLVRMHRYDMEILNERYEESALVLPHRPYALRTAEFRKHEHAEYLGDADEKWDAEKVYKEAKVIHFSDHPLPPPWFTWPGGSVSEMQPDCVGKGEGSCAERRIWMSLYQDFRKRRKDVCKLLSVPAAPWALLKQQAGLDATSTEHVAPQASS
ncbi:glycosyltransferase family 8 protein [Bipolaris maydis ATCC 48331]|uniref:Glycosyltransferase family 8 protein n=2 Tax=Cochliobolus heterostrophus TaxID=5016 RepID=M2VCI3_COCH5|nr:glycosyltransferase family 8 protein [Bipolaris maydis ATCC 48331]EMD97423.1 glycosyltransferase family 8 protein [Bipolaris maydis C5]KAH7558030.1 glycosyltransferase family 8 protein [Bipolaris maydis]ENI01438.1 glycosyltransferase family 8 protein [Bipolaris maydis ATCC 48331]KAJ5031124.1 glycosyltransferase [Bipolaris maydis]KAJ5052811.1 nucleotide-diphospho-sugar transferase [Bipolaris maydis]